MQLFRKYTLLYTFIILISFFCLNQLFSFIDDMYYNENKKKAEKPILNINKLDDYPKQFDAYFTDNFSLRGYFLNYMGWVSKHIWNKSPKPDKVIVGKDKWLFNVDKEIDNYYGKRNFDNGQLNEVLEEFKYRKRILDSLGIKMLLVINPTKYSIYPENLPEFLINENTNNSATQLINCIHDNSDIDVIYTKEYLMPLKEKYQLYYKSDNHWTDLAGYFVAKGIMKHIDAKIPVIPFDEFKFDTIHDFTGNLAFMMANANEFSETALKFSLKNDKAIEFERFKYIPSEDVGYKDEFQFGYKSKNDKLPNAVIIRDSFANALMPYLRNSFYHSTFIWDGWNYAFNLEIIEKEKPDIVIFMVLESIIPNIYTNGLTKSW